MTTKEKAERETGPFVRPGHQFYKYAKKNSGGRYASQTSEKVFEGMLNTVKLFTRRPIQPPLKKQTR
jgi:hypothetical protein